MAFRVTLLPAQSEVVPEVEMVAFGADPVEMLIGADVAEQVPLVTVTVKAPLR